MDQSWLREQNCQLYLSGAPLVLKFGQCHKYWYESVESNGYYHSL